MVILAGVTLFTLEIGRNFITLHYIKLLDYYIICVGTLLS